jgi:hypothetical protein
MLDSCKVVKLIDPSVMGMTFLMGELPTVAKRRDRAVYVANRAKFTAQQLAPYQGQWIAWSNDGSRIVAHHEDLLEVARQVENSGLNSDDVVLDLQPPTEADSEL